MAALSKNFQAYEFQCPCGECDGGVMKPSFIEKLQKMRDLVNMPLKISSGYRCPKHNKKVKGEENSRHILGMAADMTIPDGAIAYTLIFAAMTVGFKGIGVKNKKGEDEKFIHVDDRDSTAVVWTY